MAIKTILFDLDGTLVDSSSDIAAAFQYAWRSVVGGIPPSTAMIARHIGKPLTEMVSELGGELSPSLLSTFLTVYQQTYRNRNGRLTRLYPEVISSLEALSAFTLGIVTTKESDQAEMILQRLSLMSFFQHIQGSTYELPLKPAPGAVIAALDALQREPAHALMVGDTPADILAGKAAGTMTCAVTYGFGAREALLHCSPDCVIESLGELVELARESGLKRRIG